MCTRGKEDNMTQLLTLREAGARVGYTDRTMRNYINRGMLRATKIGKEWRVAEEDLQGLVGSWHDRTENRADIPGVMAR